MQKFSELENYSLEDIEKELQIVRRELFELRVKNSMRQLESPAEIRRSTHRLSQLQTLKHKLLSPKTAAH